MAGLYVVVSSQGRRLAGDVGDGPWNLLEWQLRRAGPPQALGIAKQRRFPLRRASGSDAILFLDDVFVQPFVMERLLSVLQNEDCGFVGTLPTGLKFAEDGRPDRSTVLGRIGPTVLDLIPEILER